MPSLTRLPGEQTATVEMTSSNWRLTAYSKANWERRHQMELLLGFFSVAPHEWFWLLVPIAATLYDRISNGYLGWKYLLFSSSQYEMI